MQNLKTSILLLCSFVVLFVSCNQNNDIEGDGIKTEDLTFTLDLSATIKSDEGEKALKLHFKEQVSAVALIRSSENDFIYLPLLMTRSDKNHQSVEILENQVVLGKQVVCAEKKWQMRLIVGGKWDEASKHVVFDAPSDFTLAGKSDVVAFDRPYLSAWQDIPTDETGHFMTTEAGKVSMDIQVETPSVTLAHHVMSCEAGGDVEISTLKLHAGPLALGGYLDLSDSETLKTDVAPEWNVCSDSIRELEIHFASPFTVKPGVQDSDADYIYLWAMPLKSEDKKIKVFASGCVNTKEKDKFEDLLLFDMDFEQPAHNVYQIDSKINIESTPEISGPITLGTVDDKNVIVANNKDEVTFVVTQSGVDVTSEYTLYKKNELWDDKQNGFRFVTGRPGTYVFYAEKDGIRSNNITITAIQEEEIAPDGNIINGTLFCPNVTLAEGWYDVNKIGNGNSPQDGLLCWAAAASNMLQWWLEDFKKKGNDLPERVPYGPGKIYRLAIFDTFFNTWENYMHDSESGIRWFMEGGGMKWGASNGAHPNKGNVVHEGGYFKGVLSEEKEKQLFETEYVKTYGGYYTWGYPGDNYPELQQYSTKHERFSHLLITLLKQGPSGLSVDSHELTAWGCEIRNGRVARIYVTNSDDGGDPRITGYDVITDNEGWIHLKDYPGKTNRPTEVIRLTGVKAYPF